MKTTEQRREEFVKDLKELLEKHDLKIDKDTPDDGCGCGYVYSFYGEGHYDTEEDHQVRQFVDIPISELYDEF